MKRKAIGLINGRQLAQLRRRLLSMRHLLAKDVRGLSHRDGVGTTRDSAEVASDCLELEMASYLGGVMAESLEDIELALLKIDDGTYGQCEVCNASIPFDRLQVVPAARLCVACKYIEEKEGGARQSGFQRHIRSDVFEALARFDSSDAHFSGVKSTRRVATLRHSRAAPADV